MLREIQESMQAEDLREKQMMEKANLRAQTEKKQKLDKLK